jgi:phosphate:Na+ symporter
MSLTLILLDLAGDVGLLLWGTHMVTTGVLRGYGTDFRQWLGRSLRRRMNAFLAGLVLTALLQSSTATGLMATSFAASGIIDLASGLAVMLGANVGTTLIVQVLSFNIGVVAPILILAGVVLFRRGGDGQVKNLGRIAIGLGLMLLALNLLVRTMSPIEQAPEIRGVLEALVSQPVLAMVLAALLTWACHSSVAIVLLILSLVKVGVLAPTPALVLVLGANLGATMPALWEAGSPPARRLPLGNVLIRAAGCILALPILPYISVLLARIEPEPARIVVNFHTAFNLTLAVLFIYPTNSIANWLIRLLPDPAPSADAGAPRYLEEAALGTASVALANAVRETLRMADMVRAMLKGALEVFRNDDRKRASRISHMDPTLDRVGVAVRQYLAELSGEELNEADSLRSQEIVTFTINLDYIGDILANILMEFFAARIKPGRSLAPLEFAEIASMHAQVIESLNLGLVVFLRDDEATARQLVERKKLIWQEESNAAERYFQRLRGTPVQNGGSDDFYLRILRDLKRIHSLIAALAYPILDRAGQLQSRLVEISAGEQQHPEEHVSTDEPAQKP